MCGVYMTRVRQLTPEPGEEEAAEQSFTRYLNVLENSIKVTTDQLACHRRNLYNFVVLM